MKRLIAIGVIGPLLDGCSTAPQERDRPAGAMHRRVEVVPRLESNFSQLNPHYKESAGVFYDIRYVSPSAEALFKIADIRPDQMRKTMEILRRFVDEWLGTYVEGNGSITEREVNLCVRKMDERFDALLDDVQRKQYRIWRDDETGEINKLRFLMSRPLTDQERDAQQEDPYSQEAAPPEKR